MIKKLFTKYILEVVPSIVATVVGAYIVTHYINGKSDADKPKTETAAPADTSKSDTSKTDTSKTAAPQTLKADDASDKAKADTTKADAAKAEAARLKAEKLAADKAAADRAASERAEAAKKAAAEKLASEKAASDKRDANDIARAAIERLRNAEPKVETKVETPRAPETARAEEPARNQERTPEKARVNSVVYAPAAAPQPIIQPLPPAVTVAPPPSDINVAPLQPKPEERADDGSRPTPPANIPSRPLDIRARERDRSVAEGVVSAARSVFQAVMPDSSN